MSAKIYFISGLILQRTYFLSQENNNLSAKLSSNLIFLSIGNLVGFLEKVKNNTWQFEK